MDIKDLTPKLTTKRIEQLYKRQFSDNININKLSLKESNQLLNKSIKLLNEFKSKHDVHTSQMNPSYLKLKMIKEAAELRTAKLLKTKHKLNERKMNKKYLKALKYVAEGKQLTKSQLSSINASTKLKSVLESSSSAKQFIKHYVETKRKLNESEIDQAQTILAAQDIADQVQTMIEKLVDVQYKQLPALHDSIRSTQGVEEAGTFNDSVLTSLRELTTNLETAKGDLNNAINVLTGQDVETFDADSLTAGDDLEDETELDGEEEVNDEDLDDFDVDFEPEEVNDEEVAKLGRERR